MTKFKRGGMIDITPPPEFMRAAREVLGLDVNDPTPLSPRIIIPVMRDNIVGPMVQEAYERILSMAKKNTGRIAKNLELSVGHAIENEDPRAYAVK